jgi:hypothetical protein
LQLSKSRVYVETAEAVEGITNGFANLASDGGRCRQTKGIEEDGRSVAVWVGQPMRLESPEVVTSFIRVAERISDLRGKKVTCIFDGGLLPKGIAEAAR